MNNLQAAIGFSMAARAREDLLVVNSHLAEISATLYRQAEREKVEQRAKNIVFQIKQDLLKIGQQSLDGRVVHELMEIIAYWFESKRLTEDHFSALPDKEYFAETVALAHKLTMTANQVLGADRVMDIKLYEHHSVHSLLLYPALYFHLYSRELREEDEKKQGLFGRVFYHLTPDQAATKLKNLAIRMSQEKRLKEIELKLPSKVISAKAEELSRCANKEFASSAECLEFMGRLAVFFTNVAKQNGFDEHKLFYYAVEKELQLRKIPMYRNERAAVRGRNDARKKTVVIAALANKTPVADIWLYTDQEMGPFYDKQVYELLRADRIDMSARYWMEGMEEWLPIDGLFDLLAARPEQP